MFTPILTTAAASLSETNVLTTYVTMESLLFAGLTAAVAMSSAGTLGKSLVVKPYVVARVAAGLLLVVGAGAVLSWTDLFGGHDWPAGWNRRIEALGILVGIVAQPVIASVVAINVRNRKRGD